MTQVSGTNQLELCGIGVKKLGVDDRGGGLEMNGEGLLGMRCGWKADRLEYNGLD